jgi:hypothetical protein
MEIIEVPGASFINKIMNILLFLNIPFKISHAEEFEEINLLMHSL